MLPPRLQEVKDRLKEKGYANRSTAQNELLKELEEIEEKLSKLLSEFTEYHRGAKLTSGPRGNCPCCGR